MIKKLTLAAMAVVSVSAFAQTGPRDSTMTTSAFISTHPWCPGDVAVKGKSSWELRRRIEKQADICLSGGDRFTLEYMLDRTPSDITYALLRGLAHAQNQAVMITSKILAQRFPDNAMYATTPDTLMASNIAWDGEGRPLRIVMTNPVRPKDISYDDAFEILTMKLNDTQKSLLADWWRAGADDRGVQHSDMNESYKDVICRLLRDDARMVDQTFYPSVYMHTTYSWLNDAPPF